MLEVKLTSKFKKDYKLLKEVVKKIAMQEPLDEKYRDHELVGKYKSFRKCHVQPDWLLVYLLKEEKLTLILARTGSYSDLF